ncbi:hypothetical protein COU56_02170 [Candidatus Pacearchaeota archaeon CG10_big_fil_rev_8_21_14_0_10_31_9]|nr:MAG: hypothetical protein AUJ62_01360 [Candidatus Pacearchaeota archaeon CG1_02_32_21]PIN95048.1 MAG: hypothetical protein COU56_02170 [Candidatus Pacearchaeota archaeon CG10_big_fil_rev_8_21_14_0_10_31_9]PIZ82461.1 MAG: hypothetical protein COX97_04720 [Candidatus Pacearchaeota archaeon CG_4_10_14_0_2_um_filter_05_32_18]
MQSGNLKKEHKEILRKYKHLFEILENYDKTRRLPFQRKRIYITLSNETIDELKKNKKKLGKSISKLIEESLKNS